MRRVLLLSLFLPMFISVQNAEILTEAGESLINNQVCSVVDYKLSFSDSKEREVVVYDVNTSRILEAKTIHSDEEQIDFAGNLEQVGVVVFEDGNIIESNKVYVNNCGYGNSDKSYEVSTGEIFTLNGRQIDLTFVDPENISQASISPLGKKANKLQINNGQASYNLGDNPQNIYGLEIVYKDGGKRYFEIEVYPEEDVLFSRIVDTKTQTKQNILTSKWFIITVVLFILYIIIGIFYRRAKRLEKKYLQYVKRRRGRSE